VNHDTGGDQRVDDLRRQLKALGYLDAGVDRFVLRSAHATRPPAAIAALASFRVGLLACLLLGPAAAVGIAGRLPGLVTGPRDAAVVALYLGAVFGVTFGVFAFILSTLVSRLAVDFSVGRARWTSRAAGTVVAIGSLGYLTLWWGRASEGFAWASPVWTLSALAVAVTISLLLGHAVAITSFAVIAARWRMDRRASSEPQAAMSRSTWRLVVSAGITAFAGAAALLFLTAPSAPVNDSAPPLAVVTPGFRLRVIGIDGFDPQVFDAMRAAGELPVLAGLLSKARARFDTDEVRDPAREWTTMATGQPAEIHGVRGLETRRIAGVQGALAWGGERGIARPIGAATDLLRLTRPSVASGAELRAKPFWEVAADAGLRAAVVNWWATWPALEGGAHAPLVISDRAILRLERGGTQDAEIAPPDLYERLRREWTAVVREASQAADAPMLASTDAVVSAALRRSAELDAVQLALSRRLLAERPDLLAVYLPGLDVAQHTLLDPATASGASVVASRLEAVRRYYSYLDGVVSDFAQPDADEIVVIVTHPGRRSSAGSGMLGIAGTIAGARSDASIKAVDVAPTILHLLGVPVSRELTGRPAAGILSSAFLGRFPVREVATYGARRRAGSSGRGEPLDAEALERLRSLGYVR
jgi:hypothetical protein